MDRSASGPVPELPSWLGVVGSVLIVLHLGAVLIWVLATPSGPWWSPEGPDMYSPPQFAFSLGQPAFEYLRLIKLTHSYHFPTSRHQDFAAYLEVRLKDAQGNEVARVKFPEDGANCAVRHRQATLVNWFTGDMGVMPPNGEVIPAPGQKAPTVDIWDETSPREGHLKTIPLHVLRDRPGPAMRPSDVAVLLAHSYARYLCRTHGATSAEVIRHAKPALPPFAMYPDFNGAGGFEEFTSDFGDWPPQSGAAEAR
jgi:hypothetical protein